MDNLQEKTVQQQIIMIKIKIKGPNHLPQTHHTLQHTYHTTQKHCLWIGRGQQLHDKHNQYNYTLNLSQLTQSVSRIHACLIFSPIFRINQNTYPTYYNKLPPQWLDLPSHLLFLIWQYARPARKLLIKDMHSKTGIYKKVSKSTIYPGMQIVLGDSRAIVFHHQQIHDSIEQLNSRVADLKKKGFIVLNQINGINTTQSFWIISFRQQHYILKNQIGKIYIGRSSSCQLAICQASISRRHAILQYIQGEWSISDGDGSAASSNGVWQRTKKYEINFTNKCLTTATLKIADVLFIIQMKEQQYTSLNLTQIYLTRKHSNSIDNSFSELMKISNEATIITKDSGSI